MSGLTLFEKLWQRHVIREEAGHALPYIDRLLVYEATSPQAFEGLRQVARTGRFEFFQQTEVG